MPENSEGSKPTPIIGKVRALLDLGLEKTTEEATLPKTPKKASLAKWERKIGNYQLIRELGEGGFGIVWLAEQTEPFRREVAVKLIKPGMDSRKVIARFEAERRTLAMMEHPNVAAVLDAGTTAAGRPYFVMQLVRGLPITEYCDQRRLTIKQRLELFLHVCHGVQHAHQKAILHRDLKPSNILVEDVDGVPVPKIIDFGIAKALGAEAHGQFGANSAMTNVGTVVGTPQYMSPEQAGSEMDVDACSDIYSLGAILYELLTGYPTIPSKAISKAPLPELLKIIREKEAVRPSLQISSGENKTTSAIAEKRQTNPRALAEELHSDLDWIVLKSLEKERRRRYESAAAMATDISRHLRDEPVVARPPTRGYVLRKLIRRNRLVFMAGILVAIALVSGTSAALWGYLLQRRALQVSLAAEARARNESEKSDQVASFLGSLFQDISLRNGSTLTPDALRELLDTADERRRREFLTHPETDLRVSLILARAYGELDKLEAAGSLYQNALDRFDQLHNADSLEAADCRSKLAWTHLQVIEESDRPPPLDSLVQEEQALRRSLTICQRFPREHDTALWTQALLAEALRLQGKVVPARELLETLAHGPGSEAVKGSPEYGRVLREEALLAQQSGDLERSLALLEQARKYLSGAKVTLNQHHQAEADIWRIQSALCLQSGNLEDAESAAKKELDLRHRWLGYEDPRVLANIAEIEIRGQRFPDAGAILKRSIEISQEFGWHSVREQALRKIVKYQDQLYPDDRGAWARNFNDLAQLIVLEADQIRAAKARAEKSATGAREPRAELPSAKAHSGDDVAEAVKLLESDEFIPQPYPKEAAEFFATRANLWARQEDYAKAIADLSKAASADPNSYIYRFHMAVIRLHAKDRAGYAAERESLLHDLTPDLNSNNTLWICHAALLTAIDDPASLAKLWKALYDDSTRSAGSRDDSWNALLLGMVE